MHSMHSLRASWHRVISRQRVRTECLLHQKQRRQQQTSHLYSALLHRPYSSSLSASTVRRQLGENGVLKVGDACQMQRTFTLQDGAAFTALTGDANPIHAAHNSSSASASSSSASSSSSSSASPFSQPIVHGMLASSLFSALFATTLPGAIYLSQNLSFVSPVFYGRLVRAEIIVTDVRQTSKGALLLNCDTRVVEQGEQVAATREIAASSSTKDLIVGVARVLVPAGIVTYQPSA